MKRLILLRHAKSSWDNPALDDHDRPLNARGREAAPRIGAWLACRGFMPDHVICSSSLRTRETWALVKPAFTDPPDPEIAPRLYHAEPATMLALLHAVPASAEAVAMIGHQPGIGAFARKLSSADTPPRCSRAYAKFPTGACAVIDFEAPDWGSVAWGTGRFHAFAAPRELD